MSDRRTFFLALGLMFAVSAGLVVLLDPRHPLLWWLFTGPVPVMAILVPVQEVLTGRYPRIASEDRVWVWQWLAVTLWLVEGGVLLGWKPLAQVAWLILLGVIGVLLSGPGGAAGDF